MGLYGAKTPKASWLLGSAWASQRNAWGKACVGTPNPSTAGLVGPRPWISKLENKMTKTQRDSLRQQSKETMMVNRYVDHAGRLRV